MNMETAPWTCERALCDRTYFTLSCFAPLARSATARAADSRRPLATLCPNLDQTDDLVAQGLYDGRPVRLIFHKLGSLRSIRPGDLAPNTPARSPDCPKTGVLRCSSAAPAGGEVRVIQRSRTLLEFGQFPPDGLCTRRLALEIPSTRAVRRQRQRGNLTANRRGNMLCVSSCPRTQSVLLIIADTSVS